MDHLRPYQLDALQASKERFSAGIRRQIIALPTGTGKTVLFVHVKKHHALLGRVLVVVHRRELVDQAYRAFKKWCKGVQIGIEMGELSSYSEDKVVIASVQSLGRAGTGRLGKFNRDDFDLIICDEAHHSVASTYQNIFDHFGVTDCSGKALLLGVTATPVRSDGRGLGEVFEEIVYRMDLRDAVINGWLVDIKGASARTDTNLDDVRVKPSGDFDELQLGRAVNQQVRNELVLRTWIERAPSRQTIVFCAGVQHAKDMAATFQKSGIRADAIWGEDPQRAAKLEMHKTRKLQVLTNCEVLTEGYDDWSVSCIVMARPTQSELLFVQMVGRGTRIPKDICDLGIDLNVARSRGHQIAKEDCLIIDVVDNTSKHSLVTLPTLFGFSPDHDYNGESAIRDQSIDHSLLIGKAPHPSIAARVKPIISDIDLLNIHQHKPVIPSSIFQWFTSGKGEIVLPLTKGYSFSIRREIDGWRVLAEIGANKYSRGPFRTEEDAHLDVERGMQMYCKQLVTKINNDVRRNDPERISSVTPLQKELLIEIIGHVAFVNGLIKEFSKRKVQVELENYFTQKYSGAQFNCLLKYAADRLSRERDNLTTKQVRNLIDLFLKAAKGEVKMWIPAKSTFS